MTNAIVDVAGEAAAIKELMANRAYDSIVDAAVRRAESELLWQDTPKEMVGLSFSWRDVKFYTAKALRNVGRDALQTRLDQLDAEIIAAQKKPA